MSKVIMRLNELSAPSCNGKNRSSMTTTKGVANAKVLFNASKVKAEFDENVVSTDELNQQG